MRVHKNLFGTGGEDKIDASEIFFNGDTLDKISSISIPLNTVSKLPKDYPMGMSIEWGSAGLYGVTAHTYVTVLTFRPWSDETVPTKQLLFAQSNHNTNTVYTRSGRHGLAANEWLPMSTII